MIIPINKDLIFKNKQPLEITRSKDLEIKIKKHWDRFIENNNGYFNGDIFVVTDIKETKENYIFEIGKTKYADLIYSKETDNLSCYSLFASCIFITKDNYYVLVKNNHNKLNIIGGMASKEDFINNKFSPHNCLKRELKEELNIDINDKSIISNYYPKYIKLPSKNEAMSPTGVIYICNLNYTKDDLTNYFTNSSNMFDSEIKKLVFCTKDNYLNLKNMEHKEAYFIELITLIEKEKLSLN